MDAPVFQFNQESWDAMKADETASRAFASLRLSKMLNEEAQVVASNLDKADENDIPANLYARLDNRSLPDNYTKQMMADTLSPLLMKTIADNPERASYFRGKSLINWNALAKEEEAFRAHQSYIDTVLERVKQNPVSQYEFAQSAREARERRAKWAEIQQQSKINMVVNALDAYWPTDFRKEGDAIVEARLELLNRAGIDTTGVDLEELRKTKGYQFREAVNPFGILDAVSNGEDMGWALASWKHKDVVSDMLMHVDENSPLEVQERVLDMLRKERYDTMPETTAQKMWNTAFKSISFMEEMAMTAGMSEAFGLVKAGGTPMLDKLIANGYRALYKEAGMKGIGQAVKEGVKRAGLNAIGRLPAYAPTLIGETFSDVAPQAVTLPDDFGNPAITVKESDVVDFIERLITKTVMQTSEMATEELGPLIPLGDLDAKMLAAFTPKTVRNFVAQSLIRSPMTRRIAERAILDRVPFDGLIGEFGEEVVGNFAMFGATLLAKGFGFRDENTPGVWSPFMSKNEAGVTLGSIALQSVLFRGMQIAHAEMQGRGTISLIKDAQRAKRERQHFDVSADLLSTIPVSQSNVNETRKVVESLRGGDTVVSLAAQDAADILFQMTDGKTEEEAREIRETLAKAGLTEEIVKQAKEKGTDVALSQDQLLALAANKTYKNGKDVAHTILDRAATMVFGKNTKELTSDSFTKEQLTEMAEKVKRREEFLANVQKIMSAAVRTAQQNAAASGNKLGVSEQNVRDFVGIYSWMANYLMKNVDTEEGLNELEKMVKNLSVQFAENPAAFDTAGAIEALKQVLPVWTGSAASYEQPSLQFVGTGEGAQVYGWGLYGSSDRGVAEWYAKADVRRKGKYLPPYRYAHDAARFAVTLKGGRVLADEDAFLHVEDKTDAENAWEEIVYELSDYLQGKYESGFEGTITADKLREAAIKKIDWRIKVWRDSADLGGPALANYKKVMGFLQDADKKDEIEFHDFEMRQHKGRNLYKQTFWPDKEENLLDWDRAISREQMDAINAAAAKGGFEIPQLRDGNAVEDLQVTQDREGQFLLEFWLEHVNDETAAVIIDSKGNIISADGEWVPESAKHLSDLVGAEGAQKILDSIQEHVVTHPLVSDFGVLYAPYEGLFFGVDGLPSGERIYEYLADKLGSPKAASEFLYRAGIDGVTYLGATSDARNYVAFNDADIRVDEHLLFQNDRVTKGQINLAKFAESQQAIITLFKDADASTLPHESAHWLKAAMEALVGAGFANEKMQADLQTIKDWLAKQDYTGMDEAARKRAEEEYFARAFEQYLREGRFPEAATNGLKGALRRLARVLQSIYRSAVALNAPIDDSIREFFDDIFAVDEVVDGTSVLSGILREINGEAIAMGKDELKKLEAALEGAKEDAETEAWLAALKAYQQGLRNQKTIWRNQAKEAYAASKAEAAYNYVRNGHRIDENFLRNVLKLDEDTITILRKKRLTYKGTVAAEAPAAAETSAEAVPTPAVAPEATPAAENVESTPLDGTPEQFNGLADDAYVSLPVGEEMAQNAVANLVYGPDGKGGVIWKKINVNLAEMELGDVLYKIYTVALQRLSEAEPITKKGLLGYLSRTAFTSEKQALRDKAKQAPSMDEAVYTGEDGDTVSRYDVTPDERSMRAAYDTSSEAYLIALSDFTDTLKEGSLKREIADIIYELADSGERATRDAIMTEYRSRGGKYEKTALYKAIADVRTELETYLTDNGFFQSVEASDVPADILATMQELGYSDVNALIADLQSAVGRAKFIKDFMAQRHAEYRESFLDSPEWASETGATRFLDALLAALKVTTGMKFSERVKLAKAEAQKELMESGTVRDITKGERNIEKSLRSNAAAILKALKSGKEDKAAAITAAINMHKNAAQLNAIRTLRNDIQRLVKRARRIGKSKPGSTLDGDTVNAVKSLLLRFGLSGSAPQWTTGPNDPNSVMDVLHEITGDNLDEEVAKWSPWMQSVLTGEAPATSFENLTPDQFYELVDFIDFLRGEGRASLAEIKGTFANEFATAMDAILPSLDEHKTGDYTDTVDKTMMQKLGSLARSGVHQMKTLLFLCHLLDGRTEFYGDHTIGPVRKFFQLPLSEGASRELYWYQKVSKEIKPHVLALMKAAKDRKLVFPVNNEETRRRAYPDIHGEAAAFVLLNAGAAENRQRLMESFGWSEEELDGFLRQFTKEDFEHAEAIWESLREMGTELAKVYFEERHYRMKWAELAPLHLVLNDGTEILSDGGYYPLAYRYHDSGRGYDPDIMNPFTQANRPSRPSSVRERKTNLTDLSLLMSPSVVEQSVRESAHYIGMWKPLHLANAIWSDKAFKQSVIRNFGMETYDALKQLMNHVNNPSDMERGLWKKAAQKLGASLSTMALGFKLPTMAKQYASLTIGADRLGDYFTDAVGYALRDLRGLRREVSEMSPFMRDRYNLMDRDLRVVDTEFKGPVGKAADKYRYAAFFGLKWNDLNVAAVQWYAAYNWAIHTQADMTASQARAYADDFVASTQGAARTIDTPVVQLETLGRLMTPFFGPACASANTRLAGLAVMKQMTAGERIAFAVDNFMVPGLAMALIAAVQSGLMHPDDDDDWDRIRKRSLTALLTEPVSGVPVIQDIADAAVRSAVTGKPVQNGIFEVSLFRPAEEASRDFINLLQHWDNAGYSLYIGASLAGQLAGMPVVQVYEEYEKMYQWNFGDKKSKKLEQKLKGDNRK